MIVLNKKTESYQKFLVRSLKDPKEAAEYLNAAIEDGDPKLFLLAIRNVAEARGGMKKISEQAGLNRENLYKMLSRTGNPEFKSLESLLNILGLRLAVEVKRKKAA